MSKHAGDVDGCLGLRLTGRGLGACAVMLGRGSPELFEPRLKPWLADYERIFGFQAKVRRVVVSAGERSETHLLASGRQVVGAGSGV